MSRAFILLFDSFGLGATPDAVKFGDVGANTFGHIAKWAADSGKPMSLPNLERLGLAAAAHMASGEWPAGFAMRDGFTSGNGLGLGLSGSRRLVNEFDIQSKPGEGTRVTLTQWK